MPCTSTRVLLNPRSMVRNPRVSHQIAEEIDSSNSADINSEIKCHSSLLVFRVAIDLQSRMRQMNAWLERFVFIGTSTRANLTLSSIKPLGHDYDGFSSTARSRRCLQIFNIAVKADPITVALLLKMSANLIHQIKWNCGLVAASPSEDS